MSHRTTDAPAPRRRARRHALRLLRAAAALGVLGLLGIWYLIETDAAAQQLRTLLQRRAGAIVGGTVSIGALDLDLLPFHLELTDVRVQGPDGPLAAVRRLVLDISPWGLLQRRVVISNLELERPQLDLRAPWRGGDASVRAATPALQVDLRRLRVHDGELIFAHTTARLDGELTGISLQLVPERETLFAGARADTVGQIRISGGSIDLSERNGRPGLLAPIDLDLVFGLHPRIITIDRFRLGIGSNTIEGSGTVRGFDSAQLRVHADLAVDDIFKVWVPPGPDDHAGRATFLGNLELRDGEPVLTGRLSARDARMSGVPIEVFGCDFLLHRQEVALRNVRIRAHGGRIEGRLIVDRSVRPGRVRITYEAEGLDAALLTHWQVLSGWRVAGSLSGNGSLAWSAPFRETADGRGRLQLSLPDASAIAIDRRLAPRSSSVENLEAERPHPTPSLPLPVEATFGYRLAAGTLSVEDTALLLPHSSLSFSGRIDLDGDLLLEARFETADLRMFDHLVSQYRRFRSGEPKQRLGLHGSGSGEIRIGGTLARPVVSGTVTTEALRIRNLEIGDIAATLSTSSNGDLLARPLQVQRNGGTATGSARLHIATRGYSRQDDVAPDYFLQLDLRSYPIHSKLDLNGASRDVAGQLAGALRIEGSYSGQTTGDFDLSVDSPRIDELTLESLRVRGRRVGETWWLDRLEAAGLGGTLEASGLLSLADGRLALVASARAIDLAALSEGLRLGHRLQGLLEAQTDLSGLPGQLDGTLDVVWSHAGVDGLPLGSMVLGARASGGVVGARLLGSFEQPPTGILPVPRTTIPGTAPTLLEPPSAGYSAAAAFGLTPGSAAMLRLRSDAAIVPQLLAQIGRPLPEDVALAGQLDLVVGGFPTRQESWRGSATIDGLRLQQGAFLATAGRFRAELANGRVETTGILQAGSESLSIAAGVELSTGVLDGGLEGTLSLTALRLWRPELEASGTLTGDIRLAGTVRNPRFHGEVHGNAMKLDSGWLYPLSDAVGLLELKGDRILLRHLDGLVGGSPFRASGTLPLAALLGDTGDGTGLDAEVILEGLPLEPLLGRSQAISRLINRGVIAATLSIQGSGSDWRTYSGTLTVAALELRMRDYRLALEHAVRARFEAGAVWLPDDTELIGGRTALRIAGRIGLAPLELDLRARGTLGFEPLNVLSSYWGTGGEAEIDLRVLGSPPDLAYHGTATLRDAVLSPPPLRQPIEDISARLVFEDRRVRIEDLQGGLGGGKVTGSGELFLRDSRPQSFRIGLSVRNALLRIERDVRIEVSASLVYDGTPAHSLLSGDVHLVEGLYRRRLEPDDALLELLEAPETDPDPLLSSVDLDIRVEGIDNLFVRNNLVDVAVTADFDLRGTLARPVFLGRSRLLSGRLFWNGNTFEVLQGTVEFNNPFETEAVFEIRSRTEIRRYTVELGFSGSLRRGITFNYTSTPPLSDLDLFNLLAFGQDPDSSVLQDPYSYQRALGLQATRYLADAYLAEVERGAERVFGVDRFRIAPTLSGSKTDATARLTIGKRINRNLYVTYSRLLSNSEDQLLTVEYQLTPEVRVKGTRDEDGSFGIDFLVQRRIR